MTDIGHQQGMPARLLVTLGQLIGAAIQREQAEANRQLLGALQAQALEQLAAAPPTRGPAALTSLTLHRMAEGDDGQTFMEAFDATAEACGWPAGDWPVRLLPLLAGEAQIGALVLPPAARRDYANIKRAVVDRLGLSPEDHRRRFRRARLTRTASGKKMPPRGCCSRTALEGSEG
ncbi:uncharacterized protein LOC144385315 [Gasterosteus aculeatus]